MLYLNRSGHLNTTTSAGSGGVDFNNVSLIYELSSDTSGTVDDLSNAANDGTLQNGTTITSGQTLFSNNTMLVGDNTDDGCSFDTGAEFDMGTGPFGIDLWIYPTSTGGNKFAICVGQQGSGSAQGHYAIRMNNVLGNQWTFQFKRAGVLAGDTVISSGDVTSGTGLSNIQNRWNLLTVQRTTTGGAIELFHDGVFLTSSTPTNGTIDYAGASGVVGGRYFGAVSGSSITASMGGHYGPVRIIKGEAPWPSATDFTLPTSMFPTS